VVEPGEPVLALREHPFPVRGPATAAIAASSAGTSAVVAKAERQLRQRVEAHAVIALAPEHAADAGQFQRARGAQRVLVGAPLRAGDLP
jgi:hypothetical protein